MTNLPVAYDNAVEAAALAYARDFIAIRREGDFMGLGCAPLDPDAGRRFTRRLIQHYALSDALLMLRMTEIADDWDDVDIALRGLIHELHNRHEPLPAFLATYASRIIAGYTPKRPHGRKKATNFMQDFILVYLVVDLHRRFGLRYTRNQLGKKRRASCCSVAAEAATEAGLHRGDEDAIQSIWKRLKPMVERIGMAEIVGN